MATDITPAKTLQERVGERIKEQIGDLLTEDDLKRLVETALHDAFFKPPPDLRDHWQRNNNPAPLPPIVVLVRDLLKERVDATAAAWLAANSEQVNAHIDETISKGLSSMFLAWLDGRTFSALQTFGESLKQALVR